MCVCLYAAFGTIWSWFGGVSVQEVALCFVFVCCVLNCLERVCVSECAAGGFVLCVLCMVCVCVGIIRMSVKEMKLLLF